jgi:hypothetical protein
MAVYSAVHVVMVLAVSLAALTQAFWQSAVRHAIVDWDEQIAVQACSRAVPEPPVPPAPPPPEPARFPPVAYPVKPPDPNPPVSIGWPPLPGMPPRDAAPSLEFPPPPSELLLLLEQANTTSIAAGRMRKMELVLCIREPPPIKG